MAARKRMPTFANNGRKRDREKEKEQRSSNTASGPYWRNMTNPDTEPDPKPPATPSSGIKGKSSNGIQSGSITLSNRSQKSGSRVRIEGRVTPSGRNSFEMAPKLSGVPQIFVEAAAATAATQSLRKTSIPDSSKTKPVASSRSLASPKKAKVEPSPSLAPTSTVKRIGTKAAFAKTTEDYDKIPTPPTASPTKTADSPKGSESPKEPTVENEQPEADKTNAKEVAEEEDGQKMAMCMPNMKLFPCFRGEYPTRHRPGTYQWLQRSGPKSNQVMALCECDDEEAITAEGNIITSCEVTEAHFLSIDCDDENKIDGPPPTPCKKCNPANFDTGAASYMYAFPQATEPQMMPCPAMQQFQQKQQQSQCPPCCPNQQQQQQQHQQQQHQMEQSQTVCFSMQPEMQQRSKTNAGNGLTEMLAQQLRQQMQQAQAQIAQVQMQLNSACGSTRVRKLQVLAHSPQNVNESTPAEQEEDENMEQLDVNDNDLNDNEYTDIESCSCIAEQFRFQQQQQQHQLQQQQQLQQQPTYCCGATQGQGVATQPFMFPFQFTPSPIPPAMPPLQFGCFTMPSQEQQCSPIPISCPHQGQQQQQQQQQVPQQPSYHQSSQSNSQQNMCPHGNHFCPSCYRQRYAQMRFMMPRCWPR